MCWLVEPAIVFAQQGTYHPENFTEPLSVTRGKLFPSGQSGVSGVYLSHEETCEYVVKEFGWDSADCPYLEVMLVGTNNETDLVIVHKPISDGLVTLDDWQGDNVSKEIDEITSNYKKSIAEQSKRLGKNLEFVGWKMYPTVDKINNIMYYASLANWDGNPNLNITLTIFDRRGYLKMGIVPVDSQISSDGIKQVVLAAAQSYKPTVGNSYSEFRSGDKVAGYGALGVFAGLLGVKYGKAAAAGLFAVGLVILKKAWFLLLVPFLLLGKLFGRKKNSA
jgi:uncharacterized membrane-anchored protein